MPTVLRLNGFNVRIYTNDHKPAHVHVFKADGEVRIRLGLGGNRPKLLEVSRRMSVRDAAQAVVMVEEHNDFLLLEWRKIHG